MAKLIVNQGLQVIADRVWGINGPPAAIQTMTVDDAAGAFAAAHTKLDDAAGYTQQVPKAFDATATRAGQTVSAAATWAEGEANFTIRRVALHNTAAGATTGASTGLIGGIDGQAFTKTPDFSLRITLSMTFTSVAA